ncbi:PREDICTED: transcription termination factor 4, mitochondrial [Tarenaya hassleriana]|uniref:transcription termination factor 4, mitochondrial n=1 Tax=Tarenaya hassleriana TaxID=28532 RepID=UPI00053C23D1|nr:PREDICTED: transcription termination factor 4, mitochondrial [Tarenaya hassleriana]
MAFRGRGRGRGFGGRGGGFGYAKQEPFELFPEIELPDRKAITTDPELVAGYFKFEKFWRNSPYYLGDGVSKKENVSVDIERYSDWSKPKSKSKRGSFYDYLILRPDNFPKELLGDSRRERPVKKARWSQEADIKKLDIFEKLEEKYKKSGKEDEVGEEAEEEPEEDEAEYSDDGDYNQNVDFDDDDDDYNQQDDGDDEPTF